MLGKGRIADGRRASGRRPIAVIARDPRISGEFLSSAVAAGLASSGVDVFDAGVVPTPGLAFLVADLRADFGVMISASHNPAPDNGIKFFAAGGVKLPDEVEERIEAALRGPEAQRRPAPTWVASAGSRMPRTATSCTCCRRCRTGSTASTSCSTARTAPPPASRRRCSPTPGARVTVIGADPDGLNINDGVGSTHLDTLASAVVHHGADVGIAHDGDADRCLAVDHLGHVVDGDQIMAILALVDGRARRARQAHARRDRDEQPRPRRAMAEHDIRVVETTVGDRYVLEALAADGLSLGGEQSGHVIMTEFATTGDGILTGLHLVAEMARTRRSLAELASVHDGLPAGAGQRSRRRSPCAGRRRGDRRSRCARPRRAGRSGRVLLRPSGTEPMVRVMVEAEHQETAQLIADGLADVVRQRLGLDEPGDLPSDH